MNEQKQTKGQDMKSVNYESDLIIRWARKLGYSVDEHWANTGTRYLSCSYDLFDYKIRVADHGECYCSEDMSVDPDGHTAHQAISKLAKLAKKPEPPFIKAQRTRLVKLEEAAAIRRDIIKKEIADNKALYNKELDAWKAEQTEDQIDYYNNFSHIKSFVRDNKGRELAGAVVGKNAYKKMEAVHYNERYHAAWIEAGRL